MKDQQMKNERGREISRRELLGSAAAAAAFTMVPGAPLRGANAATHEKPNSVIDGVRIGTITYSFRSMETTGEGTLQAILKCGLSEVELMSGPVDDYVGLSSGGRRRRRRRGEQMTDEQRKELRQQQEEEWLQQRLAVPMEKYRTLRKMYNDAGVNIHIVKFGNIGAASMTDEEIDNTFNVAKALGATTITRELSEDIAKRLGPFADKHKIWIGFHNHTQITPTTYDGDVLSYGDYLGINLDIGHYVAGTGESPIPLMEKHHERIVSLHLKDRTKAGGNLPWGQGETPIKEVLQLMRKNHWTFPADIELEYRVPQDSDAVTEVIKCLQYCKEALA